MKEMPASDVYQGGRARCDICSKIVQGNTKIYHCPDVKSNVHPRGYDLCQDCASKPV